MDFEEIRTASAPLVREIHDESVRTTLLLFGFLFCVIVFAAVFLKGRRSPLAWIISLTIFSALILVRAGGLKEPELAVVQGRIHGVAAEGPRCGVRLENARIWQRAEPGSGSKPGPLELPALCSLSRILVKGSEETLILIRGTVLGLQRNGRSTFFRNEEDKG